MARVRASVRLGTAGVGVLLAVACGSGEPDFCDRELYGGGPGASGTALDPAWSDLAPLLSGTDRRVCVSGAERTVVELSGQQLDAFFAVGDQLAARGFRVAAAPDGGEDLEAIYVRDDDGVALHAYYREGWDLTSLELSRCDRECLEWRTRSE